MPVEHDGARAHDLWGTLVALSSYAAALVRAAQLYETWQERRRARADRDASLRSEASEAPPPGPPLV